MMQQYVNDTRNVLKKVADLQEQIAFINKVRALLFFTRYNLGQLAKAPGLRLQSLSHMFNSRAEHRLWYLKKGHLSVVFLVGSKMSNCFPVMLSSSAW